MKLTDYFDLLDMSTWSRRTLEKKHIELLKKYHELDKSSINSADSIFFVAISFLVGMLIAFAIIEFGGYIK